jgi:hypothetical protein
VEEADINNRMTASDMIDGVDGVWESEWGGAFPSTRFPGMLPGAPGLDIDGSRVQGLAFCHPGSEVTR